MAKTKSNIARVLVEKEHEGCTYKPNDLVEFPESDIEKLELDGVIDASDEGVAYCKKDLKKEVIKHVAVKQLDVVSAEKVGDK